MDDPRHPQAAPSRILPVTRSTTAALLAVLLVAAVATSTHRADAAPMQAVPVSGEGVHLFSTAIVHSQRPTPTGMVQRSTDIVTLTGDLHGHILYHPTATFDLSSDTLEVTGTQFFSGTIHGSEPVILHDDRFRFEVDLTTGATVGQVFLGRSNDAPHPGRWSECHLDVVGTGLTPAGDATFVYSGACTHRGR